MSRIVALLSALVVPAAAWAQEATSFPTSVPATAVATTAPAATTTAINNAVAALNAATASTNAVAPVCKDPGVFVYAVVGLVALGLIMALAALRKGLATGDWKLADALSEEAELSDSGGAKVTKLVASSSRLTAFVGLLAIFFLFVGFGIFVLLQFGCTGVLSNQVGGIVTFLAGGLTLFAPYAVNKLTNIAGN